MDHIKSVYRILVRVSLWETKFGSSSWGHVHSYMSVIILCMIFLCMCIPSQYDSTKYEPGWCVWDREINRLLIIKSLSILNYKDICNKIQAYNVPTSTHLPLSITFHLHPHFPSCLAYSQTPLWKVLFSFTIVIVCSLPNLPSTPPQWQASHWRPILFIVSIAIRNCYSPMKFHYIHIWERSFWVFFLSLIFFSLISPDNCTCSGTCNFLFCIIAILQQIWWQYFLKAKY